MNLVQWYMMRRGAIRLVVFLGGLLLLAGILTLEYSGYGNTHPRIQVSQGSSIAAAAPGLKDVQDVGLKYPWGHKLRSVSDPSVKSTNSELLPGMIAPNVYFMWCGKDRWFEFKHYLSVLSASQAFHVDKVVFSYQHLPAMDKMYYNLWYGDLKHDLPFFIEAPMEEWQLKYCESGSTGQEKLDVILRVLNQEGGIFITENTWIFHVAPERRLVNLEMAFDVDAAEGLVWMRQGMLNNSTMDDLLATQGDKFKRQQCSRVHHVYYGPDLGVCTVVKEGKFERIWPMDIWELDDPFGRLVRRIFYGTEDILKPIPDNSTLVPNIGHMVWIGGGKMDFVFYLSVLSMVFVANVEKVYIHGDAEPGGDYWRMLKENPTTRDRILFNHRAPPYMIYQGVIEPWYRALMSDIIRVDLMIKYGGVYTDTDAIWVKPLTLEDRTYDAVASFDWVDWSWPYPDSVNFGVSYGKKNAPFWQVFRESMRTLHNDHHGFTGVMMPYKVLEKYPNLLRIDRHLAPICYYSKCHPIFQTDYHNMSLDHTNTHSLDNWRQDINAFHWTHPNPPEYANLTTLTRAKGIFADVGRNVLQKAGLIS